MVHRIFFHPLSKFKGPFLWKTFRFPFILALVGGDLPHQIKRLHDRYGSVVRVGPNELSFTDPAAWRDIHSRNFARASQYSNRPPGKDAENLISANQSDHTRFRKVLGPAFSEKSIQEQSHVIDSSINLLMQKFHQMIADNKSNNVITIDVLNWYNYTALDVIGHIIWSSPFGCLDGGHYPSWLQFINQFKVTMIKVAFRYFPPANAILELITPKAALTGLIQVWNNIEINLSKRLVTSDSSPDVISHVVAANKGPSESYMSHTEIEINALSLIVAGSESVTTVLTGVTNYLLREPVKLQRLVHEIRSTFPNESDISSVSTSRQRYLYAVLQEGMRLCPTIPDGMRRVVPKGGATVAGYFLPEDTVVSIPQWAAYQSDSNFHSPSSFAPERWLPESRLPSSPYRLDRQDTFNPFSLGPRNCLGRGLALLEMRLILTKMLWNFDMTEGAELPIWEKQKIYWFWVKQPTYVSLTKAR